MLEYGALDRGLGRAPVTGAAHICTRSRRRISGNGPGSLPRSGPGVATLTVVAATGGFGLFFEPFGRPHFLGAGAALAASSFARSPAFSCLSSATSLSRPT